MMVRVFQKMISEASAFTYIGALILVVVSGIALGQASKFWKTAAKRERETELLYRGDCIRNAIASYYAAGNGQYPSGFRSLLKDPRFPGVKRHLRRVYKDPMTPDGAWGLIRGKHGGIKGVFSKSKATPLKTGNFPEAYAEFEKTASYSEWKFVFVPETAAKSASNSVNN